MLGTILGVPAIRFILFQSLYWGTLFLGNHHIGRWVRSLKGSI